ncbi:MAG: putative transposase [Gammaproteobacteria bacterium]
MPPRCATATLERLAASLGQLDAAPPRFEHALDIPNGGVLLALPALLVSGLLRHATQYFQLPPRLLWVGDDFSAVGLHGFSSAQVH